MSVPDRPGPPAPTHDLNVAGFRPLVTPRELKHELPITPSSQSTIVASRGVIRAILDGRDPRFLALVGPCSIHDVAAAEEYAGRLATLARDLSDRLFVVMRVYFEKPRTTTGWKGLINDPHLDGSFDMGLGLRLARRLLLHVTALGLPAGTEMLDPITPQYIDDLVSWASIGARTIESQTHRQMASGLSMPVGYKNTTEGRLDPALDAMRAALEPHSFLGMDEDGRTCIVATRGNPAGHLILRGGREMPNFEPAAVEQAARQMDRAGLPPRIMVDCSHANSLKRHERQSAVWESVVAQRAAGNRALIGAMLESHLHPGRQDITLPVSTLRHGVSVTDACIGWDETERLLRGAWHQFA